MHSQMVDGLNSKPIMMVQISLNFQQCGILHDWVERTDSSLKGEKGQPFVSSASLSIALDYCLQFLTLIKILLSLFQPFDSNNISQHFTFSAQVHSQKYFFLGKKNFLCQFQAITHCLLEILLVSETCQKTFYSVSLQHTSLKDLVGFYIPSAAVVFKFILNIMSCLSGNAN